MRLTRICFLLSVILFHGHLGAITLDECQRLAKENYPLLEQYNVITAVADAEQENVSKNYLPQISAYGQASWQNNVTSFPESVKQLFGSLGVEMAGLSKDQYKIGIEANQIVWDGGNTKVSKQMAQTKAEVNRAKNDVGMYEIVNSVNDIYFNILLYKHQLALNDELQDVLSENLSVVEANFVNGTATENDVATIKAHILEAKRDRIGLEHNLTANKRMLGLYVGRDVGSENFECPSLGELFPVNADNRPEMSMYEAQLKHLDVQRQSVNASVMPQIGLFANGYYGNPGLDMFDAMFYDEWSFNFLVGVKLQWNIGELYRKKSNMKKIYALSRGIKNEQEVFRFKINLLTEQQQAMIDGKRKEIEADGDIVDLRESIRQASEAKLRDGIILVNDLMRDVMDENNARIVKNIHEIELLHSIYKLKYIVNQ